MRVARRHRLRLLGALICTFATVAAFAQTLPPPQNVVSLSARAGVEVPQDLVSISLAATRDGSASAQVQSELRQVLDAALTEARKAIRPGQVDVHGGQFTIAPRYARQGGITGWHGSAELIVEGKDLAAISALVARLPGMVVTRVAYGLSRDARERVEADVAAEAIARFKSRAESYAKQFGFAGYTIREVTVSGGDAAPQPLNQLRAMAAGAAAGDESQPLEAGKTVISASVNGSVQMTPR